MKRSVEVLTAEKMKLVYGKFWDASPKVHLSRKKVPDDLHPLIPYAEFWGITDDGIRFNLLYDAPDELLQNMKTVVLSYEKNWVAWLTGPAMRRKPFLEYVSFAALAMAADWVISPSERK